ncbi:hypothetical protein [Haladaptatus salinisoli]|uniref:hypothetical protein n=1 Tax=Haladaptatus salinisoli TaxID=2884876 RepID=UPI001D0B035E|nr:hypothetical protein [Haladaptatus salinisoli]
MDELDFPNIITFLDNVGKADEVERALNERFTQRDLETLNQYLTSIDFDKDRYAVWGRMIRNEQNMPMITELTLVHHLRLVYGTGAVDLHEPISSKPNSLDFDVRVNMSGTNVWIEVTYENLDEKIDKPGFFSRKMTGFQIDDKIEKDFAAARSSLGEDEVLILAIYLEAPPLQQIMTGVRLAEGGKHEIPAFLDGYLEFSNFWDPTFNYQPFTENGESFGNDL